MSVVWAVLKAAAVLTAGGFFTMRVIPWVFVRAGRLLGFAMRLNPTTAKRVARFRRIKRGYWAFVAVSTLFVTSFFLELLVNHKPLAVGYEGRVSFPAVKDWASKVLFLPVSSFHAKDDYGQTGRSEVDYREFARSCSDPDSVVRDFEAALAAERAEWEKENPKPPADATQRTKDRWQRDLNRKFGKRNADLEVVRRSAETFRTRAWIVPALYPYGPSENRLNFKDPPPNSPSLALGIPLGTDMTGRDIFVQLLYGFRLSMAFSLLVAFVGTAIGVIIGGVQGYYLGWVDIVSQRAEEIWSAIPFLYVIIIVAATIQPSFMIIAGLMIALRAWVGTTFYVRGEFLREKSKDYVQAAIGMGVPSWKIMLQHILPNSMVPIVTFTPFAIVGYISTLVSLDYLGFGLPPGTPSWGALLHQGMDNVTHNPHLIWIPSIALAVTLYLVVLIGEAVREAFDPKVFSRLR